jgi:hypothetical protein
MAWLIAALLLQPPVLKELAGASDEQLLDVLMKALNPTSNQFNLKFELKWTPVQAEGTEPGLEIKFEPKVPWYLFRQENLLRVTVPYEAGLSSQQGRIGTVELLDLVILSPAWGRWGIGPVVFIPDKPPQFGPAFGFSRRDGSVSSGFLAQTLLNSESAQTIFQPNFGVALSHWLSLGLGDPKEIYDYRSGEFTALRISVEAALLLKPWGQHVRLSIKPEYDFARQAAGQRWDITFGVVLISPTRE